MTETRTAVISRRKAAFQGTAYTDTWLGLKAVFTTYEGERLIGTITRFEDEYPVVTFEDGRHARLDTHVELVVGG